MNKKLVGVLVLTVIMLMTGSNLMAQEVTLQFAQWWEPELPEGEFRALMDEFEAANPGITVELLSGPYSTTRDQTVAGAATGTMADVVGLDGAWVNDFVRQGSLASLTQLMSDAGYDASELAAQIQLNNETWMIPVVNFVYPVFVNLDLLNAAGIETHPAHAANLQKQPLQLPTQMTTSPVGCCRCRWSNRTASRTMSCRGCGRAVAA
jgi:multiple sugar transport system substrate-binding protein